MSDETPFIQTIKINKVRHLENINIEIDNKRPRHLILTGPNGCGKTSVLVFLKNYLEGIPNRKILEVESWRNQIIQIKQNINGQKVIRDDDLYDNAQRSAAISNINAYKKNIDNLTKNINKFESIIPTIFNMPELVESYHKSEFLISYFDAKRIASIHPVNGAQKLDLPKISPIVVNNNNSLNARFLQFLVNQENRSAMLARKGETSEVEKIDTWMEGITAKFRELFQNEELKLEYDIDNFDFKIIIPGREPFGLVNNQLSDGYSSVIQIVSELLLRMEAVSKSKYDMPGIVLIDEIETHLHIELQKNILPFLTSFFPNIQFIVTTHSPFVLSSLADSVIFDLETQKREENFAPLSSSTIVEEYFDSDLYSTVSKKMIADYERLSKLTKLSKEDEIALGKLHSELELLDYEDAPELVAKYKQLRAKESHR